MSPQLMKKVMQHPMYTDSDYEYLDGKGYTASEILTIWDRDFNNGVAPVVHAEVINIVGYFGWTPEDVAAL